MASVVDEGCGAHGDSPTPGVHVHGQGSSVERLCRRPAKWAMGQLRWHSASDELINRCSQMDIYTKYWHKPRDLNSFIMPLSGMIWKAFNNTILLFCLKTIQEGERRQPPTAGQVILHNRRSFHFVTLRPSLIRDSSEERYEKGDEPYFDSYILVSNVAPVEATAFFSIPDWGSTADGYD